MAKRGQKIDELYLDIGLNIAQLQLDFDTAGKTVSDSIARLNSKANNIHLKLDADLAKLDGVGTELDKIKVRHQAINRELEAYDPELLKKPAPTHRYCRKNKDNYARYRRR